MGAISTETQDDVHVKKGYQLNDRVGVAGVEQTYEDELRGKPGYINYAVDAKNHILGVVDGPSRRPATTCSSRST